MSNTTTGNEFVLFNNLLDADGEPLYLPINTRAEVARALELLAEDDSDSLPIFCGEGPDSYRTGFTLSK